MPTRLILIRHGETEWNLKRRYCGWTDIGLSSKGKAQAKKLHKKIKEEIVHKVYVSDRKRAIETAEIVFKNREIEKIPGLKEIHFGCFEGLTHKQILQKYPEIYAKWLRDPHKHHVPSGEKLNDFKKRITASINKIIRLNPQKTIAVVCHGGAISIFITGILKNNKFWKFIPHSASVSIIEYNGRGPRVRLLDDTSHL